jgi:hypothetical protein
VHGTQNPVLGLGLGVSTVEQCLKRTNINFKVSILLEIHVGTKASLPPSQCQEVVCIGNSMLSSNVQWWCLARRIMCPVLGIGSTDQNVV